MQPEPPVSDVLFQPLQIKSLTLKNRIVMAPMTREMAPNGVPGDDMARYYRRRAAGGAGLIVTEGIAPDEAGRFGVNVPSFLGEAALAGWRDIVTQVHAEGTAIFAQIWHVGAFEPSLIGMQNSLPPSVERLSPSGLASATLRMGRAMNERDIEDAITSFAAAARAAQGLGFDGLEIHGAHGYLPDQFFWSATNQRTDRCGGDAVERTRFACELVRACKRATSADFAVCLRFSQWKQLDYSAKLFENPLELERFLRPLVDAGLDMLHCSTRRFWEPAFAGDAATLAAWTRKLSGLPTIAVGSVGLSNDLKSAEGRRKAEVDFQSLELLADQMAAGDFDCIAIGRAMLAAPDWPRYLRENRLLDLPAFSKAALDTLL